MEVVAVFVVLVAVVIGIRLAAGSIDTGRIEEHVREQGGTLLDKSWDPFGPGWLGEQNARIYRIRYRDARGNVHEAHVKTSMFSGVYLTNDHIVERAENRAAKGEATAESLRRENERLRRRLRRLEQNRK